MKFHPVIFVWAAAFAFAAFADDCTSYWGSTLGTNPLEAKPFSGDTHVGYGLFSVHGDNRTKFVVKGKFPYARFMSLQTYNTKFQQNIDSILDRDIEPDAGSENPFRPGVPMETPNRSFTLELVPEAYYTGAPNQVRMAKGHLNHNFFYRMYAPHAGVTFTQNDLPRVYSYDAETNRPSRCPKVIHTSPYLNIPQFVINVAAHFIPFEFKEKSGVVGSNAGIPAYQYTIVKMDRSDVAHIRFRSASFINTRNGAGPFPDGADTRYWSICLQNFVRNETLACLPDFQANDPDGWVNLIVGSGAAVKEAAHERGFNFIEDTRGKNQKVMGFIYRNVLPDDKFAETRMYRDDYLPRGVLCPRADFLSGRCDF